MTGCPPESTRGTPSGGRVVMPACPPHADEAGPGSPRLPVPPPPSPVPGAGAPGTGLADQVFDLNARAEIARAQSGGQR